MGSSGLKKEPARERETREGEVPSPLACLPLARPFFFAPTISKRRCKVSTIVRRLQPARPLGSLFRRSVGRTCLSFFFSAVSCRAFLEPCRVNVKRLLPINGGIHDALTTIREAYMTALNKNSKMEDKSEVCKQ